MKHLFFLLVSFSIIACSKGQTIAELQTQIATTSTTTTSASLEGRASLYQTSDLALTSAFAYTPDATINTTGGTINFSSTTVKSIGLALKNPDTGDTMWHVFEDWETPYIVQVNSMGLGYVGMFIGLRNNNQTAASRWGFQIGNHGGIANTFLITPELNGTLYSTGQLTAGTFTNGDYVAINVSRQGNYIVLRLQNLTAGTAAYTITQQLGNVSGCSYCNVPSLVSAFYLEFRQGNFSVINGAAYTRDGNAEAGKLGDSHTTGAGYYDDGWASLFKKVVPSSFRYSGASSRTDDLLKTLPALKRAGAPKYLIIEAGTNDYNQSVPQATIDSNYVALVNGAVAIGSIPILKSIPPYNSVDVRALNTFIPSRFPQYQFINVFPLLSNSGTYTYLSGYSDDGLHENKTGNAVDAAKTIADYASTHMLSATRSINFDGGISATGLQQNSGSNLMMVAADTSGSKNNFYLQTIPTGTTGSYINNSTTQQTADINISGTLTVGGMASGGTAPTSSGTTKIVLTDANGKHTFSGSSISQSNGTLTSSGPVAASVGSVSAPGFYLGTHTGTGWYSVADGTESFASSGVAQAIFGANTGLGTITKSLRLRNNMILGWSNGSPDAVADDSYIYWLSAGNLRTNASLTVDGKVIAGAAMRLKGYTFATLPTATQGDCAYITDASSPAYGGTASGGGSTVARVFYNGTAWVYQ